MAGFKDRQSAFSVEALAINESVSGIAFFSGAHSELVLITDMVAGDLFYCTTHKREYRYDGIRWHIYCTYPVNTVLVGETLVIEEYKEMRVRSLTNQGAVYVHGALVIDGAG